MTVDQDTRPTVHPLFGTCDAPAYAWIITRDSITPKDEEGYATGSAGPRWATDADIARAREEGEPFRLLDDDGEPYYYGRVWYGEGVTEDDGNPLDDFGAGWAGCTRMQYRDADGDWSDVIG